MWTDFDYTIALQDVRGSSGGRELSSEAARICALLIVMSEREQNFNPDRSYQYRDASPAKLLDQLNENWKQLRTFKAAVDDRDRIISSLHESIAKRDESIKLVNKQLKLAKVRIALMYALLGGIGAKGAEAIVVALLPFLHHAVR